MTVNKNIEGKKGKQTEPDLYTADNNSTILHKKNFFFHGFPSLSIDLAYQFSYLTFLDGLMNVENSLVTSCNNHLQEN